MNVTVLGSSGLVGRELIRLLEEKNFPVENLKLLGNKDAGRVVNFKNKELFIEKADKESFLGSHIVFGCADSTVTEKFLPFIIKSGAYFIDNSSLLRGRDDVPLVIPEINSNLITKESRLIANPNCCTIIILLSIYPIIKMYGLRSLNATSMQAVSGAGKGALREFYLETELYNKKEDYKPRYLSETIVGNVIPKIGTLEDNLYTEEEMKLFNEAKKILNDSDIKISCTSVRVPVERCHSFALSLICKEKPDINKVREEILKAPYLREYFGSYFPSPLKMERKEKIGIGRVRKSLLDDKGIELFVSGDQLLRGASLNALKIGEHLVKTCF